ncbi:Glycosyl transferase family 2 [Clostridium cavendishii DSM 21758]|uniref:Glycosyl transferase family 2 n=1 Tax=Clostridium cavendishii DSM 21758 TaxID=1121302 RepID=A0A1M6AZJ1_9CLOT|nr:glycosyltransferase [Clostridium cavendishii]SHI41890.1 Glycosyl transferase family 2 [Clostridium cavendishii DSM 21758]
MISVIMPVYNCEDYVSQSIECILNQTFKDFEFIIIDDGSTDNTLDIIKYYAEKDNRIVCISRENRGLVRSLNEGIKISNRKYIARMDADDLCTLDRLEKQYSYMEKNNNVDFLGCDYEVFFDNDVFDVENRIELNNFDAEEFIIGKGYSICHPSFFIRKEVLNKLLNYDLENNFAEDLALQIKFLKNNIKIGILDETLIKVRKHIDSKSNKETNLNAIETMKLRVDYIYNKYNLINKKVFIWGAGGGGQLVANYLTSSYENINILGYIDSYKKGEVNGVRIISWNEIESYDYDYVLIATRPGKFYAQQILNALGIKAMEKYFTIFT